MSSNRRHALLTVYAVVLAAIALSVVLAMVASGIRLGPWYAVLILASLAVVAERHAVRLTSSVEISIASLTFVFAAVVFGPLAAVVVGATGLLTDLRRPYLRWLLWTATRSLVAAGSGLMVLAADLSTASGLTVLVLAVTVACITEAVLDLLLTALVPVLRGNGSLSELPRAVLPVLFYSLPLHITLVSGLAYLYNTVSSWSVLLSLIPAYAAQRLFLLYRQQQEDALQLKEANLLLEDANLSFATALVATLEARDRYTAGHSTAVAGYAKATAVSLGLSSQQSDLAHLAGLVHDLGKIGLSAALLEKPGPLTSSERIEMERHPEIAEKILRKVDTYAEVAQIVRHHHERVDGQGYPDRLQGENIPLISRILAVVDAYDAMTSDRPYRRAMATFEARQRLQQAAGLQFDSRIVAAFDRIVEESSAEVRVPRARTNDPARSRLVREALSKVG